MKGFKVFVGVRGGDGREIVFKLKRRIIVDVVESFIDI